MDMHKELYDIMNYYLGEKDRRDNIRLPNEYEELRDAIGKHLTHTFRAGKNAGSIVVCEKIKSLTDNLWYVQKNLFKKVIDTKPKYYTDRAKEGYLNRNPEEVDKNSES